MHYEDSLDPYPQDSRPDNVPEKFWDPSTDTVRTDALLRAYQDLERRMHTMVKVPSDECCASERADFHRALGVPDSPDGYRISQRHPMVSSCPDINGRLHEAGFTPRQAQLVYDLAYERVVPMVEDMRAEYESRHSLDKLREHFGGDTRWNAAARQILGWGKANLPQDVFDALSSSAEGVMAMRTMMASGEPVIGRAAVPADEPMSEDTLKKMMKDPRYWKKRDPAFIEKVSAGFRRLTGEE